MQTRKGGCKLFWEILNEDLIFTDLDVKSSDEVFETLGGKMEQLGYGKDTFVQALKDRERVYPTAIMADTRGIAIPHTDVEHVQSSAIAIATLKNPVTFYQMGTNPADGVEVPVQFVIMLAVAGGGHIDMLQKAVLIIQDLSLVDKIMETKDAKAIIDMIREKEEKL